MGVGKERAERGRGCFERFWVRRGRTGRDAEQEAGLKDPGISRGLGRREESG